MLTCSWQLIKTTNTFFNNLWPIFLLHKTTITNDWPSNFQNGLMLCKVFGHLSMNFPCLILNSAIGPIFRLARTSGPKKMDQCHQTVFALLVRAWLGTRLHFNGQNTFSLHESASGFLNYSNSVCLIGIHSAH